MVPPLQSREWAAGVSKPWADLFPCACVREYFPGEIAAFVLRGFHPPSSAIPALPFSLYICVCVSLSFTALHANVVSSLTLTTCHHSSSSVPYSVHTCFYALHFPISPSCLPLSPSLPDFSSLSFPHPSQSSSPLCLPVAVPYVPVPSSLPLPRLPLPGTLLRKKTVDKHELCPIVCVLHECTLPSFPTPTIHPFLCFCLGGRGAFIPRTSSSSTHRALDSLLTPLT